MSTTPPPGSGVLRRTKQKYERDFTIIPNGYLRHADLSFKARGLLGLILSYQDGFQISIRQLAKQSIKEGRDAVASALNELLEHGYLERRRVNDPRTGAVLWEYRLLEPETVMQAFVLPAAEGGGSSATLDENQESPGQDVAGLPNTDEPNTDEPNTDNPAILKKNLLEEDSSTQVSEVTTEGAPAVDPLTQFDACPGLSTSRRLERHVLTKWGTCSKCTELDPRPAA